VAQAESAKIGRRDRVKAAERDIGNLAG